MDPSSKEALGSVKWGGRKVFSKKLPLPRLRFFD